MIITLMQDEKIIANIKRRHNLFMLDLATPNQVIFAKVIAMREKSHFIHFFS